MPDRGARSVVSPGAVTSLCPPPCHSTIGSAKPACRRCWERLPWSLRSAWEAAEDGGGKTLEKAAKAIREHLREKAANG